MAGINRGTFKTSRDSCIDYIRMQEPRKKYYVLNLKPPKQPPEPLKWPVKKPQKQKKQDSKPLPVRR
jgi:hypothetical protein